MIETGETVNRRFFNGPIFLYFADWTFELKGLFFRRADAPSRIFTHGLVLVPVLDRSMRRYGERKIIEALFEQVFKCYHPIKAC